MDNSLRIITGKDVDLICPFPISEIKRTYGWVHCYRTITECDDSPKDIDSYSAMMSQVLPRVVSWGMIDKNHLTNIKHEAPLVGFGMFEPSLMPNGTIRSGYLHVATARRAWKANLVDEATDLVLADLFEGLPSLLRVSAYMADKNAPAKALVRRHGFRYEGLIEDSILVENSPENLVLFGLTRRNYNALCQPKCLVESEPVSVEQSDNSLEVPQPQPQLMAIVVE